MNRFIKTLGVATSLIALQMAAPMAAHSAGTIVVGTDVDAGTLDSRLARDTTAARVADLIYAGLVHLNPQLEAEPDMAQSWENPDPQTWIFKLRPGLTFSDGSPLTSADVVYTFETLTDQDFNAPRRGLYTPISKVTAVDETTVQFDLSAPYAPLLSYMDIGIVPKALAESGHDLALEPVGSGPMKLVSWNRGNEIVLEPNPNYWAGTAGVDGLTLKVIGDNSARAQAFEAGDLNVIQSPLSPQDIARLEKDDRFGNAILAGLGVTYLNINTADPLLSDPKMRKAVAMLVDQETIVNDLYQGADQVVSSVILPSSWAYDPSIKQPGFDPEGAVAIFNELGWKDSDGDGLLDKDGENLEITLATHSEDPNRVQAIEFLQAVFQSAGVDAKTYISDWPSFFSGHVQSKEYQIALLGWLNIVDPDRLMYSQFKTDGAFNWGGYSNAEVDALVEEGRSSLEQDARTKAYRKAAAIVAEELPYYIISAQGYQLFYDKSIEVDATPLGTLRGLIDLPQ